MPLRTLGNLSFQKEKEEMKGSLQIFKKLASGKMKEEGSHVDF